MMNPRKTMLTPSAGFTARVMARIEMHERARAHRRALIGGMVLVAAALALIAFVAVVLIAWLGSFVVRVDALMSAIVDLVLWLEVSRTFLQALWMLVSLATLGGNNLVVLTYALSALILTVVWTRVVFGPFQQLSPQSSWEVKR